LASPLIFLPVRIDVIEKQLQLCRQLSSPDGPGPAREIYHAKKKGGGEVHDRGRNGLPVGKTETGMPNTIHQPKQKKARRVNQNE
jgi:hypothetical protein